MHEGNASRDARVAMKRNANPFSGYKDPRWTWSRIVIGKSELVYGTLLRCLAHISLELDVLLRYHRGDLQVSRNVALPVETAFSSQALLTQTSIVIHVFEVVLVVELHEVIAVKRWHPVGVTVEVRPVEWPKRTARLERHDLLKPMRVVVCPDLTNWQRQKQLPIIWINSYNKVTNNYK